MKKFYVLLLMTVLCLVTSMPLMAQGRSEVAQQSRAEVSHAIHHDKTTKPLREMFDTGKRRGPARGGRDFEPGRPQPVGNINREFVDPLADRSVSSPSALVEMAGLRPGSVAVANGSAVHGGFLSPDGTPRSSKPFQCRDRPAVPLALFARPF